MPHDSSGHDTVSGSAFDDLTALAAHVCGTPMACVSLADGRQHWFESDHGMDFTDTTLLLAFCDPARHRTTTLLEVPDTWRDPRLADHPMVSGEPGIRFYAAAPLVLADGHVLGALCVFGTQPQMLSDVQRRHLAALARQVVSQLELRRQARRFAAGERARLVTDTALREQQRMLNGVLEHTDVLIYAKDVEGRFVMTNRVLDKIAPTDGPMIGLTDYDLFDTETADGYRRNDAQIMATREWRVFSEELVHPDGSVHTYRSTKFPLIDDAGAVIGIGGVSTDVTELAAARAAHAEAEQRWRKLVEQSPTAVTVVDAGGIIVFANTEAARLCGVASAADLLSTPVAEMVSPGERDAAQQMIDDILAGNLELKALRAHLHRLDGRVAKVEVNGRVVEQANPRTVQFEFRDMTALAKSYAALKHLALTDPLTGLLNRRAWDGRLRDVLAEVRSSGAELTLAVVDLDHFKVYNDTHGHDAGDALLQTFTTVAGASLRRTDVFARWGGEEFLIALPATTLEQAHQILGRVGRSVPAGETCSIGFTAYRRSEPLSETLARADRALYLAKGRGRDQIVLL